MDQIVPSVEVVDLVSDSDDEEYRSKRIRNDLKATISSSSQVVVILDDSDEECSDFHIHKKNSDSSDAFQSKPVPFQRPLFDALDGYHIKAEIKSEPSHPKSQKTKPRPEVVGNSTPKKRKKTSNAKDPSSQGGDTSKRKRKRKSTDTTVEDDQDNSDPEESPGNGSEMDETTLSHPKETGHILQIDMENFMCHEKFSISFCRNINFITGSNGSGKSAIVSAIQLCLGSSAKVTGRGGQLSAFVKEGTEGPAIIQVTLLNEGGDAYRPEVYGSRIVIERKIFKSGSSSFTTYCQRNQKLGMISNERAEIENILKYFSVYVDNPCCVLTQEEAKRFLQGEETEKYDFFLKASGLYRAKEELKIIKDLLEKTMDNKEKCEQTLNLKKEDTNKMFQELNVIKDFEEEQKKVALIEAKTYWIKVYSHEKNWKELQVEFEEYFQEVAEKERFVKDIRLEYESKGNIKVLHEKIKQIDQNLIRTKNQIDEKKQNIVKYSKQVNNSKTSLQQQETRKQELLDRLEEIKDEITKRKDQSNTTQEEEKISDLTDELQSVQSRLRECEDRDIELNDKMRQIHSQRQQLDHDFKNHLSIVNDIESLSQSNYSQPKLFNLSSDENINTNEAKAIHQRLQLYGSKFIALNERISSCKYFEDKVIGPIGLFISLKDEYIDANIGIERILSRLLSSYLVRTLSDQTLLQSLIIEIFGRKYSSPQVIIHQPEPRYNLSKALAIASQSTARNVLQALSVSNDDAFNVLVTLIHPENILLVKNEEEMVQYVTMIDGQLGFMDDYIKAVTYSGVIYKYRYGNQCMEMPSQRHASQTFRLLSNNNEALRTSHEANSQSDHTIQDVKALKQTIVDLREKLSQLESSNKSMSNEIKDIKTEYVQLKRKQRELQYNLEECNTMIKEGNEWQLKLIQEEKDIRSELEELNETIQSLEVNYKSLKELIESSKSEEATLRQESDELSNELVVQQERIQSFIASTVDIKEKLRQNQIELQKMKNHEMILRKQLESEEREYQSLYDKAVKKSKELIAEWDEKPLAIDYNDTVNQLQSQVKVLSDDLEDRMTQFQRDHHVREISFEKMKREYNTAMEELQITQDSYEMFISRVNELEQDYSKRYGAWKSQRRRLSHDVNKLFDNYLQGQGFHGRILFNHKDRLLHLIVQKDPIDSQNVDEQALKSDIRQLSGGERSFISLCFLLALGNIVESPFRVLDEYDVYLDHEFRNYTLSRLEQHALEPRQVSKQFFIITPHNLDVIQPSDHVKIYVVPPPCNLAHGSSISQLNFD